MNEKEQKIVTKLANVYDYTLLNALDALLRDVPNAGYRYILGNDPSAIQARLYWGYKRLLTLEYVYQKMCNSKFKIGQIPWVGREYRMEKKYIQGLKDGAQLEGRLWVATIHLLKAMRHMGCPMNPYVEFALIVLESDASLTNLISFDFITAPVPVTRTQIIEKWQSQNAYLYGLDETAPPPWESPLLANWLIVTAIRLANNDNSFRKQYYTPWVKARTALVRAYDTKEAFVADIVPTKNPGTYKVIAKVLHS